MGCAGVLAVRDYLQAADKVTVADTDTLARPQSMAIAFKDVCFSYDGKENVIDHLSLKIKSGEKIALVGVNGAGKTTLVKLLCGLYKPQSGQIFINGQPAEEMPFGERIAYLAVIFQENLILPYSVAENVSLQPLDKTEMDYVVQCLKQVGLYEAVATCSEGVRTQMTKAISESGLTLSGGQQQKLLMARMLYRKNASIWILDEPTAALDPIAESEIYSQFHQLCGERTCVYISHRLASTRFLDRIIVLENGRIIEEGSHGELIRRSGRYAQLFEMQKQYYKEADTDGKTAEA